MNKYFIFCLSFMLFSACNSSSIPSTVLSPEELEPVIWDLMAAGEMRMSDTTQATRLHMKDSSTASFQYVLKIHKMDKKAFFDSYQYYEMHPDKQAILIDSLIAFNERRIKVLNKNKTNPKKITPSDEEHKPLPAPVAK